MDCSTPGFPAITNSLRLLKLMSIETVMPSNHLILCCPLLLQPSIFPSIRILSKESVLCNRWPKCWSFSFIISSSSEYSGWISLRIDWWDLLASPKGSQESSPTPQFKRFNSSALSFLYSPLSWWCHPTISSSVIPFSFPSIRVFSNESILLIRWPKYWSFSFNISPSNEHPGLISFRMDWLDLLAVQRALKRLLQHQSSKTSILLSSAFFIVQLSHPYMTTGKTIALTRWTFVVKVMSLLFNMLSRLVITFLPMSKCLLISWLQ